MFTQQLKAIRASGLNVWILIPSILSGLLVSACYIGAAAVSAAIFSELLGARDLTTLTILIGVVIVLLVVRPLIEVGGNLLQNRVGLVVKTRLRLALLKELDRQGPMRVGLGRAGTVQSAITDGVEAIEPYFVKYFTQLVVTAVTALSLTIWIAKVSPLVAVVLLICAILVIAIPRLWDKALAERGQTHWIAYEDLNADFIDSMMGMTTLKSFGAANSYGAQLATQSKQLLKSTLGQLRLSLGESGLSSMMKVLGPAIGLLVAITQVRTGVISLESLFFITLLSVEMFRPFAQLSIFWHEAFFGVSALWSINEILSDCKDPAKGNAHAQAVTLDCNSKILFEDVSYVYPGGGEPALVKASLEVPAGLTTAIVGLSGSGKSTALGLLMGFDTPQSGQVLISGVSPTALDIAKSVTLVPQDPIIFPGTIREILHAANPGASDEEMMGVLRLAEAVNLHTEIKVGEGDKAVLDVMIFEHSKNLSGGQKQRLAIARALIRNAPILVLDESTSALDTDTEHRMLANIREAKLELTLLLVTHRIDTARKADRVVVMADATVACFGDPNELANDDGSTWAELVKTQLGVV